MKNQICSAIDCHHVIEFRYKSVLRRVEPYFLGINTKENLALRAWQISGGSSEGWRLFLIDEIEGSISDLDFEFEIRGDYDPDDDGFLEAICRVS